MIKEIFKILRNKNLNYNNIDFNFKLIIDEDLDEFTEKSYSIRCYEADKLLGYLYNLFSISELLLINNISKIMVKN